MLITATLTLCLAGCSSAKGTKEEREAVKRVEFYAEVPHASPNFIRRFLADEGFTAEEADFGITNSDVYWDAHAIACAEMYFENILIDMSAEKIEKTMITEGFTEEQTKMAIEKYQAEHK